MLGNLLFWLKTLFLKTDDTPKKFLGELISSRENKPKGVVVWVKRTERSPIMRDEGAQEPRHTNSTKSQGQEILQQMKTARSARKEIGWRS